MFVDSVGRCPVAHSVKCEMRVGFALKICI